MLRCVGLWSVVAGGAETWRLCISLSSLHCFIWHSTNWCTARVQKICRRRTNNALDGTPSCISDKQPGHRPSGYWSPYIQTVASTIPIPSRSCTTFSSVTEYHLRYQIIPIALKNPISLYNNFHKTNLRALFYRSNLLLGVTFYIDARMTNYRCIDNASLTTL